MTSESVETYQLSCYGFIGAFHPESFSFLQ